MSCVFRVVGDSLEIDVLLEEVSMDPYRVWHKGEPRNWRYPDGKRYDCSGVCFSVSEAEMSAFNVQVADAINFLNAHQNDIKVIVSFPRVEEAALDFGINLERSFLNCDYLPPEILRLAGNLNVAIELSHYPPTEEEDVPNGES